MTRISVQKLWPRIFRGACLGLFSGILWGTSNPSGPLAGAALPVVTAAHPGSHPGRRFLEVDTHRSGTYHHGAWSYAYDIQDVDRPEEMRRGWLSFQGERLDHYAKPGQLMRTPWGIMIFQPGAPRTEGWLLDLPHEQPLDLQGHEQIPSPLAAKRLAQLESHPERIQLLLLYSGPQSTPPLPNVALRAMGAKQEVNSDQALVHIDAAEARQLMHYLALEGFLDVAHDAREKDPSAFGRGYLMQVFTQIGSTPVTYQEFIPWGSWILTHFQHLRDQLNGQQGQEELTRVVNRLEAHRQEFPR